MCVCVCGGGGGGGGSALLMEKRPLVGSEIYDICMQCHLYNSFDSVGLKKKWKPKLIRSDFEAVVVEIGRHFLPDRKKNIE